MRRTTVSLIALGALLSTAACTNAGATAAGTAANPADGAAATSSAAAGSSEITTTASEAVKKLVPADVAAKGRLTFAMDASYAPFEYFDTDNTTIIGFDADLSKLIAQKMGLEAKDVNTGFDTILAGLASRKHDIGMSAFSATPERAKNVDFVVYLAGGSGIAVKAGNPKQLSMDPKKLCGAKVSAQKGSIQGLDYLPKFSQDCTAAGEKPITVQLYPSQNEANLAVTSGRADAVLADSISMAYQAKESKGAFELAPGDDYDPTDVAVAVPNDSPLVEPISAALKELHQDGTLKKLLEKWGVPAQAMTQAEVGKVVR